jgi:glycosidase
VKCGISFIENALMWLLEYRFDGLRLDAVHAIDNPGFLQELAQRVREQVDTGRHVWLVLENELNQASLLRHDFDAQWNDDGHNVLHVLLTGETDAYYRDFAEEPTANWRAAWAKGSSSRATPPATAMGAASRAGFAPHCVRGLPAEPRPDRQPRPGRTPAPALPAPGAQGRHHPAAAVTDDPADVHGR